MEFWLGEVGFLALVKMDGIGDWMGFWLGEVKFLASVKVTGALVLAGGS
jgi:hypothetical protein